MRFYNLILTTSFAALLANVAWADVMIYNGGSPDLYGTYYADANYVYTTDAEPFVLSAGFSTVSSAEFWGGCFQEVTCPSADLTVSFYTDNSGAPGTLLASYAVGNADQTLTGRLIGGSFDEYSYSTTFAPLALTAGTTYFFAVGNDTGETDTGGRKLRTKLVPTSSIATLRLRRPLLAVRTLGPGI